ncbi:hypothetical protein BOX15_Mlig034257g1, partial [Macrostomum lignano]
AGCAKMRLPSASRQAIPLSRLALVTVLCISLLSLILSIAPLHSQHPGGRLHFPGEISDRHGLGPIEPDPHLLSDRAAIFAGAEADHRLALATARLRRRLMSAAAEAGALRVNAQTSQAAFSRLLAAARYPAVFRSAALSPPGPDTGADLNNATVRSMRRRLRAMLRSAWRAYWRYARGANELRPIGGAPAGPGAGDADLLGGAARLGASAIDSLDSLWMAGLTEEFSAAAEWTLNELSFDQDATVSVFEMNIRFLGGLLSAYFLTGDRRFVAKATGLASRLLPAFATPSGLLRSLVNLRTGAAADHPWAPFGCSVLAEAGSLQLEFSLLSELTGDRVYADAARRARHAIGMAPRPYGGLYPNFVHSGRPDKLAVQEASLGSLGDSFYEYLLKEWLRTNGTDTESCRLFLDAARAIEHGGLLRRSTGSGKFLYLAPLKDGRPVDNRMEHLACFAGGLFALAANATPSCAAGGRQLDSERTRRRWLSIGVELTRTCREAYRRSAVGLGPEAFEFDNNVEAVAIRPEDKTHMLRPETVESYFHLWRITGDQRYRDWAWETVEALERYSRIVSTGGFAILSDVYSARPPVGDLQPSYFLAETLKYLYLIFSDRDYFSSAQWVFNTEGHPLPVRQT